MNDRRPRRNLTINGLEALDERAVPASFGLTSSPVLLQHSLGLAQVGTAHSPMPISTLPTISYIGATPTPGHFVFRR